ncbi:ABC transporter ATP-binding protein [Thioclava sp. GXIMD4215]|uniref:ABC transporter ATP-binding protein n=1 Tax=Thioclava sp. GXIMD4215 TaxID=3131928 RepID=UPI0032492BC2
MSDTHLHINGINKFFGQTQALTDIDLKVARGEFVCLLGPSGCGKTTLLRIIAGFEGASSGSLQLDGTDISALSPDKRGFGMVFQSLALFPHMSVADNIAYGLKLRKASRAERRSRVEELLNVIQLPHIADRPVSALSGGQRQRVAIARALAVRPKLFLLDEPLSALDAKLRDAMQVELRQLQRQFGVTTILVTHDQTEAMMLADNLVVMKDGVIRQSGNPSNVYRRPADPFVADFLGSANILDGQVLGDGVLRLMGHDLAVPAPFLRGSKVRVALRSEDITLRPETGGVLTGTVEFARDLGPQTEWIIASGGDTLRVRTGREIGAVPIGQKIGLDFSADALSVFPA